MIIKIILKENIIYIIFWTGYFGKSMGIAQNNQFTRFEDLNSRLGQPIYQNLRTENWFYDST